MEKTLLRYMITARECVSTIYEEAKGVVIILTILLTADTLFINISTRRGVKFRE